MSSSVSYLRIGSSALAWFLIAEKKSVEFGAVWVVSDLLSWMCVLFCHGNKKTPKTDKLLRNVADIMWASILMFSRVIVSCLAPIEWYSQMINRDYLMQKTCLLFLILFVSKWFKMYAFELAGERRAKVGYGIEFAITDFFNHPYVGRLFYSAVNLYFYSQYLIQLWDGDVQVRIPEGTAIYEETNMAIKIGKMLYPVFVIVAVVQLIDIRLGAARIIDMDVDEKKAEIETKTAKSK
jgi:hypothetical protein